MVTLRTVLVSAAVSVFALAGCTADKALDAATHGAGAKPPPPPPAAAPVAAVAPPAARKVEFAENDFVDSDRNRDPFRSFAAVFQPTTRKVAQNQRTVILNQYSLDELKLVAIVASGDYPRAMMIDPTGKGWVIKRGDFLARPEVVHVGGANGADYQLNWRVDKVREGDVVFLRDDPAQPGIPPASRVISLRPEGEPKAQLTD